MAVGCDVLLDVSGLGGLIGEPAAIAAELTRAIVDAGVAARVAIAPTQTAARLLAAGADAFGVGSRGSRASVVTGDPEAAVAALPVALLQEIEADEAAAQNCRASAPASAEGGRLNVRDRLRPYETFERWGIATLGDLAALPAAALASRLGRRGNALQRLARGLDPRPFVPDPETPRYIERLDLEWPIDSLEPLSFILARLLDPLSTALERADRGAAAIRLDLRLTDRSTHSRVLQLPAPMRDARVLRTLLLLDLESHPPCAAVDIVMVEADPAPARITQFSLLERALPSPETLSTLTARLSALLGDARCGTAQLVDTHRPGAFVMQRFAPHDRGVPEAIAIGSGPACTTVLRRQRIPPAIRVRVEHGRPVHVASARRGMPAGAVIEAAGPWRTSGEWWKQGADGAEGAERSGERGPVAPKPRSGEGGWNRDEWDVALTDGTVCRIFQDRWTTRWFLDGVYD